MALFYADRVGQTSTTSGTGTFDLDGSIDGFQGFVAAGAGGQTVKYFAKEGTAWEVGIGVVTDASPDTLTRAVLLDSSTGSAINFAGAQEIYLDAPAEDFHEHPQICQGRLTATTGTPVTTADATSSTLYLTPYKGNKMALYGNGRWKVFTFSELSLAIGGLTTGKPYDIFAYDNSGSPTLEALVWTNDTTRATALATQDGVYVKSGDATRRYLGTIYTITDSTVKVRDSAAERKIWNYYNRVHRHMVVQETTNSWSYSTASYRSLNNSTANRLQFVRGVSEDLVIAQTTQSSRTSSASQWSHGIGLDSTSADSSSLKGYGWHSGAGVTRTESSWYIGQPSAGFHYLQALEYGGTGMTFYGDDGGDFLKSGIKGEVWA